MKRKLLDHHGVALAAALLLFLTCVVTAMTITINFNTHNKRTEAVHDFEAQYISASSAARLIRDSLTDTENMNVLTIVCLQCANLENENKQMTVTVKADGMPPAVCKIAFDVDLNITATVRTENLALRLTLPTDSPGKPAWSKKNALISRLLTSEAENEP